MYLLFAYGKFVLAVITDDHTPLTFILLVIFNSTSWHDELTIRIGTFHVFKFAFFDMFLGRDKHERVRALSQPWNGVQSTLYHCMVGRRITITSKREFNVPVHGQLLNLQRTRRDIIVFLQARSWNTWKEKIEKVDSRIITSSTKQPAWKYALTTAWTGYAVRSVLQKEMLIYC